MLMMPGTIFHYAQCVERLALHVLMLC